MRLATNKPTISQHKIQFFLSSSSRQRVSKDEKMCLWKSFGFLWRSSVSVKQTRGKNITVWIKQGTLSSSDNYINNAANTAGSASK